MLVRVDDSAVLVIPDDTSPSGCNLVRFQTALPPIPQVMHPPMVTGVVFAAGRTLGVVMVTDGWIMTARVENGKIIDELVVVHDQPYRCREALPTPRQMLESGLMLNFGGARNVEVLTLQGADAGESLSLYARDRRVTGVFGSIDTDQQYWLVTFECDEAEAMAFDDANWLCATIEIVGVDEFLLVERP